MDNKKGCMIKNYGLDINNIEIKPEDWKFGSNIPLEKINQDKDWEKYLPEYEAQADKYETWGCTVWGSQNQIETMLKFLFDEDYNFDERYNYNISEIIPPGGDPNRVLEDIRKFGLIQGHLPIPETFDDFMIPRPMSGDLLEKGKEFLNKYKLNHEWIISSNPNMIKELIVAALSYSPVAISVTLQRSPDENGLYTDNGIPNNHWCLCFGYRETPEGVVLKIFDSYDHSKKELHPKHNVMFAKRISIEKIEVEKKIQPSWWQKLWAWIVRERFILREFRRDLNKYY